MTKLEQLGSAGCPQPSRRRPRATLRLVRRALASASARAIGRALGLSSALVFGLLTAERVLPHVVERLTERAWNAELVPLVVWGHIAGDDEKVGVSQLIAFAGLMGVVAVVTAAYALVRTLAERVRILRWPARSADVLMPVLALVAATRESRFEGQLADACLGVSTAALAAWCGLQAPRASRVASDRADTTFALIAESAALGWGLWLTGPRELGVMLAVPAFAAVAAACWRAGNTRLRSDARRDALSGVPLLFLPLVGLLRSPSILWCIGAVALAGIARLALGRRGRPLLSARLPTWVIGVAAPSAFALIAWLPNRFRELPNENMSDHESFHLGWISSMTYGKFMYADAAFIYGPAREYLLAILARSMGSLTLEHVRLAHIAVNALGAALLLWAGWIVARRSAWLLALWCYLVVTRTPLFFFADYTAGLSFGWADLLRIGGGIAVVLAALRALERVGASRRSLAPLAALGGCAGVSLLYSQDAGIAAAAAVTLVLLLDPFLRRRELDLFARLARGGRTAGAFLLGAATLVGGFCAVYAACGRWRGLLDAVRATREAGSGVFGATVYPVSATDLGTAASLYADAGGFYGCRFDYVLPVGFLVLGVGAILAAIFYGRWTARTAQMAGLVLFSGAAFRYTLFRADMWHISGGAVPCYLVALGLIADACAFEVHVSPSRRGNLRPFVPVFVGMTLWAIYAQESANAGLGQRARRIASGEEIPSQGQPFSYPIARAGDERITDKTLHLVDYIREHTTPFDPIWVTMHFVGGSQLYFLAERRDATRYDIWSEVMTHYECDLALHDLKRDPPALILGPMWRDYTQEVTDYVDQNWRLERRIDGVEIRRFSPGAGPGSPQ
jgi:hypothetical protein